MLRAAVSRAVQLLGSTSGPQPLRNIEPKFTKLFINNEWLDSSTSCTIGSFNPANGKLITEVEEADWKDVDIAVQVTEFQTTRADGAASATPRSENSTNRPRPPHIRFPVEFSTRSPTVVFADSRLDDAVQQAHYGMFFNDGRRYSAGSRSFVEAKVYDEFVDRSKDLAERLIVGDPFEPSTQQGPQIDGHQVKEILRHVEKGKREGALLVTGGTKWGDRGHYVLPTVLANVGDHMAIAQEEVGFSMLCTAQ
ncbi:hypothetical protein GCK32_007391 [Trichostrongylus colubriformis]|uniref:Aldehyde dehydrogenase domain-containing protein n=1 Tax=Trichostrongylus colubriformis TaxID=6319 RepID=A0AAN8FDH6_TRICO